MTYTLDKTCDKHGCAKFCLEPRLHEFDNCFGGRARMGDIDGIIERKGHILIIEWKSGADLECFDAIHQAQLITAKAFTANNEKHQWWFVIGNPQTMEVQHVRRVSRGDWVGDWANIDLAQLKGGLTSWWSKANG